MKLAIFPSKMIRENFTQPLVFHVWIFSGKKGVFLVGGISLRWHETYLANLSVLHPILFVFCVFLAYDFSFQFIFVFDFCLRKAEQKRERCLPSAN